MHQPQVEVMQEFTVVLGVNGAGLINCLYLPDNGVCVQLVPMDCDRKLNFRQYGELLEARGPYMVWFNTHRELHRPTRTGDNAQADTVIHVGEFVELVEEALQKSNQYLAEHSSLAPGKPLRPDKHEL